MMTTKATKEVIQYAGSSRSQTTKQALATSSAIGSSTGIEGDGECVRREWPRSGSLLKWTENKTG